MTNKNEAEGNAHDFAEKHMSDAYNESDTYHREIRPLISRVHDLCTKHGLPFLFVCTVANFPDERRFQTAKSVYFNGAARTPIQLLAAEHAAGADSDTAFTVKAILSVAAPLNHHEDVPEDATIN